MLASCGRIDQRQPRFRVEAPLQMSRRFGQDDFQGRTDLTLDEVPAMRRCICLADGHMRMHLWLAVLERNVAHEGEHLDLLVDGDVPILLGLPVEVRHDDTRERADRGELRRAQLVFGCERSDGTHGFVADGKYQRKRAETTMFVQQGCCHATPPLMTSAKWYARRPVSWWICSRQLNPLATITVSSEAARTAGRS